MERSRSSRIIKSGSALLAVVIIVVVILLINQKRRIDEHHEAVLKESIDINAAYDTRIDGFFKYADVKARERGKVLEARRSDLERYSAEEYGMAHLSMWDVSGLSSDKYTELFGIRAQYADYLYENPLELKEYLSTILDSGNSIVHLYINIDPYILEKNYYDATTYDKEAVSFEEYIHEEIFPILDAHPDVRFEFFLPAFPTSYWASIPISDYSTIIEKWYEFLMYLHWCPNAEVRYMGDVEWLVSNDLNYVSEKRLKDDVMQKVYIYLYAYIQYDVTPPELKQKKGSLDKYIRKYINGEYDICDLSGQKVVFLGDSLFDYISADSVAVPGVVERMTKADCYNLSMGGTTMSAIDELGFTRVANSLAMKSALDHDSRYKREAERFLKNYTDDDELTFVILYGMNDYFSNV
ncbi:MAG: hypothetical protein J5626_07170, partial [Lachnospiraceae bacterium]|nr:hypothetical protein [Lachnospiraceae bacterium]